MADMESKKFKYLLNQQTLINKASKAILLCNTELFDEMVGELKQENDDKSSMSTSMSTATDIVIKDILDDYKELLNADERHYIIKCIKWCIKKSFYQQALTVIESRMPDEFVKNGLVYYAKNYQMLRDTVRELRNKDIKSNLQYGYIKKYYYDKSDHNGRGKWICEHICDNDCQEKHVHYYTNVSDKDKLKKLIMQYFNICKYRNGVNHANSESIQDTKIIDEMNNFIDEYTEILESISSSDVPIVNNETKEKEEKEFIRKVFNNEILEYKFSDEKKYSKYCELLTEINDLDRIKDKLIQVLKEGGYKFIENKPLIYQIITNDIFYLKGKDDNDLKLIKKYIQPTKNCTTPKERFLYLCREHSRYLHYFIEEQIQKI